MLNRFRHQFLGWWSRLVSQRPGWVLCFGILLAIASISAAYSNLHFESDRNALIDRDLAWNQRFIAWRSMFPNTSDLVVAVDTYNQAGEPDPQAEQRAKALVDELARRLRERGTVLSVIWGFDPSQAHPRALRLAPLPQFEAQLAELEQVQPLLRSPTPGALVAQAMQQMQGAQQGGTAPSVAANGVTDAPIHGAAAIDQFRSLIDAFTERLRTPAEQPFNLAREVENGAGAADDWQYLRTDNGRLLLIQVRPRRDNEDLSPYKAAIDDIRGVLADVRAAHPGVSFGLTGIEAIEADETAAATADSTFASIIAVILIAMVLVIAFHSVRVPLMLITALGIGIGWTFGFAALAVGHLQVISVVFVVLLLGLGIAFGIHLASGFELVRHAFPDTRAGFQAALQQTLERVGPGLLTGAVTTAAAFAMTMFTNFRGVAEMGMIAGAGVIFCLIAMCSIYPALLRLVKPAHRHFKPMASRRVHVFQERWVMPFVRHPRWTLVVAGVLTLASLAAITQMRFDYNLMALMPRGVSSVEWQRRIVEQGEQSVWAATTIVDDMAEARRYTERFRALETVESVGGVGRLVPEHAEQRERMLDDARQRMGDDVHRVLRGAAATKPQQTEGDPQLLQQVASLRFAMGFASLGAPPELQPKLDELQQSLEAFMQTASALPAEQRSARLDALQRDYQQWRVDVAQRLDQVLAEGPVQLSDLPANLLAGYVSQSVEGAAGDVSAGERKLALEVHPRLPDGVSDPLDPRFLGRFVEDVYSVDPEATGVVVQIYESGELIWRSYLWAGLYALLVVFVLVTIDFKSLNDATLALTPVAVGFAITFAVMYVAGEAINPANIIVLPLMFGIGVDAGVHILHRYRQSPHDQPPGLTAGTGKGVTLTSLTTMIGFGTLMLASHRGIVGLGFVLTVGIGLTMLACWTIMPAWLELRNQRRARRQRLRIPSAAGPPEQVEVS